VARKHDSDDQSFLFDAGVQPALAGDELRSLGERLPLAVHLGTSSWSFPGWRGIVYADQHVEQDLARRGLEAYSKHPLLRTVGIDRAYYAPVREHEFAAYAAQVPAGFRFLTKTYERLLRPWERDGSANALFLDAAYMVDHVVGPVARGLGSRAGPVLLQFAPMNLASLAKDARRTRADGARRLIEGLGALLAKLPRPAPDDAWFYAVEVRNSELLTTQYADVLRACDAVHCYNGHPTMPDVARQAEVLAGFGLEPGGSGGAMPVVCRWMLHPSLAYEPAKERYAPFTEIVDADDRARDQFAGLVLPAAARRRAAFVIVNNKAEGSAPKTVERLARVIADGLR
jgi:uncharacterized protein YecE (DUF72 family)